jgi:hypothetical protein
MSTIDKKSDVALERLPQRPTSARTDDSAPGLLRDIRENKKAVCYALAVMTGILLYGYDFVIVGTVSSLKAFQWVSVSISRRRHFLAD